MAANGVHITIDETRRETGLSLRLQDGKLAR